MSRPEDDGGFLGRWAKRKQAVQLETEQRTPAPEFDNDKDELPDPITSKPAIAGQKADVPELPMPSLDDVLPGGDVSMFLQKHVPDALRNMALRKAWASDPEISGFIEMAENQWDFNNPDSIPGFSSTLEGVDLKAMVERVFNNVAPPRADELEDTADDAELAKNAAHQATHETDENIIMDTKSTRKVENVSVNMPKISETELHVATQKNTVESGIYDTSKKRHGSALPS